MISARALARFGIWAVGLGVGATVGSTPGIASADGLDFQISIDGQDLLPTADNSATATSSMGNFAIAFGDGSKAESLTGTGNFAFADGTNAAAIAGAGNDNTAIDIGNNNATGLIPVDANDSVGTFALAGEGNDDLAVIIGNDNEAIASGQILPEGFDSSHDTAFVFNPFGTGDDVVNVGVNNEVPGNYDIGGVLFDNNIINTDASGADFLYDIVTPFATEMNTAAATAAEWWAELLALF